jgi:limonene-1,2-epoxide hydrolase
LILGQWALGDETKLMGMFDVSDDEIVNIRDGFDAGNVTSPAMRAIRIGETGDQD